MILQPSARPWCWPVPSAFYQVPSESSHVPMRGWRSTAVLACSLYRLTVDET